MTRKLGHVFLGEQQDRGGKGVVKHDPHRRVDVDQRAVLAGRMIDSNALMRRERRSAAAVPLVQPVERTSVAELRPIVLHSVAEYTLAPRPMQHHTFDRSHNGASGFLAGECFYCGRCFHLLLHWLRSCPARTGRSNVAARYALAGGRAVRIFPHLPRDNPKSSSRGKAWAKSI